MSRMGTFRSGLLPLAGAVCAVVLVGWTVAGPEGDRGILVGVALAGAVQLAHSFTLGRRLRAAPAESRLTLATVGTVLRGAAVVAVGWLVSRSSLPVAPTLLSLTSVFFVAVLLEAFSLNSGTRTGS